MYTVHVVVLCTCTCICVIYMYMYMQWCYVYVHVHIVVFGYMYVYMQQSYVYVHVIVLCTLICSNVYPSSLDVQKSRINILIKSFKMLYRNMRSLYSSIQLTRKIICDTKYGRIVAIILYSSNEYLSWLNICLVQTSG